MTWRRLYVLGLMALWLMVLAVVAKSSVDRLSVPPWGNPAGDSLSAEVAGSTRVGQAFTAPLPGLYRIDLALAQATASGAQRVTFHLKTDLNASDDLWTAEFSTDTVHDDVPYRFEFPPLRDSKGQTYYFFLESAGSAPGNAVAVRYSPGAILDGASAYLNDEPMAGNLQFHTFYTLRTRDKVDLLLTRMAEGRPYFFGSKGFYIGLAVAYALVLSAFLFQIARVILEEQEDRV